MNGILLYKGRYGATKQYADWLGTELRLPVIDPDMMDEKLLTACDFLLIGTSVYNGELLLKSWLKAHQHHLKHKKLFFFIVCAPSPDETQYSQIIMDNIPGAVLRPSTDIFFLPGRWIHSRLSPSDSRALKQKALTEPDPLKSQALLQDDDAVKKEHTGRVVGSIRSFADL